MPTYQYHCDECNEPFEARRRFTDGPLTTCPEGHEGSVRRIFQPAGIIFKGSGWYIKDSKAGGTIPSGSNGEAANGASKASKESGAKGEGASSAPSSKGESAGSSTSDKGE